MARRAGPSVRSRRLATVLRTLRIAAELSRADVSQAIDMSISKIGRVETAETGIYLDDLEKLLDLYRVTGSRRVEVLDLARHADERGWLRILGTTRHSENWQTWIDFESEASVLLHYQPLIIPGLLQTPDYARAIIRSTGTGIDLSDADVDTLVSSRMARQGILSKTNPVKLHAVIEETVLRRSLHADSLDRQLRHLVESAARPNITIQLLPVDVGPHPGLNGPFIILEYDAEPSLVWLENRISSLFLDEPDQIEIYTRIWNELCALACNPEKSIKLISAMIRTI
jgi:transcriptional regulator with XRE-family HTH domain